MTRTEGYKKREIFFLAIAILVFSGLIWYFSYRWLLSIEANQTIMLVVPIVFFVFSALGLVLIYNLLRLYIYKQKGVKGYKLRGKITVYFILTILVSILVFAGLMFYLIFLIESTFIEEERKISTSLLNDYKIMFNYYQKHFEENLLSRTNDLNSFPVILKIKKTNLILEKNNSTLKIPEIVSNFSHFNFFYSIRGNVFYSEYVKGVAFISQNSAYYGENIPLPLDEAIPAMKKNEEMLEKIKKLRNLIFPVSLISVIILSIPILFAAFYVGLFAARNITVPVEKLLKGTLYLSKNLNYRVKVNSRDELEDLANNFNLMAENLKEAYQKIKRIERIEVWQEVARKLAHEIKNPLTPIKLSAERLLLTYTKNRENFENIFDKTLTTIIEETKRIENLVNEFSKFLRLPPLNIQKQNIIEVILEVKDFFSNAYPEINFIIKNEFDEFILEFDKEKIKQVLYNLVKNAVEATQEKKIIIGTELKDNNFRVYVKDFGKGIDSEIEEQIFKPYFTTKNDGNGIGLALSERIIAEHNGQLDFINDEIGVTFYFELPLKGDEGER
ncbi:MAG: ATP-binding protein [Brevinematales bacterium]|nr:ATP-binding protein [Brevinematales bacterium]